jgi:hypothetical protein
MGAISRTMLRLLRACVAICLFVVPFCPSVYAQTVSSDSQPSSTGDASPDAPSSVPDDSEQPDPAPDQNRGPDQNGGRMFGVLPNYATVERATHADPISPQRKFGLARLSTFDPYTFAFVGLISEVSRHYGPGTEGFVKQYAASFSDNAIGNFMTTGVFPSLLHQDPRYYQHGNGSIGGRALYAFSRVLVTHGDSGGLQVNASEIAGTGVAAALSNGYYPEGQRTASATVSRWCTQILWDGLSNELKEFWPDVRRRLHH